MMMMMMIRTCACGRRGYLATSIRKQPPRRFIRSSRLRLDEKRAAAALESVIANGSFDEALDGWREGRSLIDGL